MFDLSHITEIAQRAFAISRGACEPPLTHPSRDWLIGLCIFSIIMVLGSVHSAREFIAFGDVSVQEGRETHGMPEYHELEVATALRTFGERATLFESLRANAPVSTSTAPVVSVTGTEETNSVPAVPVEGESTLE